MATNLIFGIPTVSIAAADGGVSSTLTVTDTNKLYNPFGGSKVDRYSVDTAATGDCRIKINSGGAAADFLAIGDGRLLAKQGVTAVRLRGKNSDDYATATEVYANTSFDTATFYGSETKDFYTTFNSATFTYWYLNMNSPSLSTIFPLSKLYLGTQFDFGRDPSFPGEMKRIRAGAFSRIPLYSFSFLWRGVTAAKTYLADTYFGKTRDYQPVFAWTTTYHYTLNGLRLAYLRVTDFKIEPGTANTFDISMDLEEAI